MHKAEIRRLLLIGVCSVALALTVFATWRYPSRGEIEPELSPANGSQQRVTDSDTNQLMEPSVIHEKVGIARRPLDLENIGDSQKSEDPSDPERAPASDTVNRLLITDLDSRELPNESGELRLAPSGGDAVRVPIEKGQFSLRSLPAGRIDIISAEINSAGKILHVAFEREWFEYQRGEAVLLEGRFLADAFLRVVDRETGGALDGIRVLRGQGDPTLNHPGPHFPSAFVAQADTSPVQLPWNRGIQPYWVTAKGYSWSFVRVDHETGGEREIQLDSAGKIIVEVTGDVESYLTQSVNAYIRIYRADTGDLTASSALSSTQGFDGMSTGRYDVSVELDSADQDERVLGSTQVDVTHGTTAIARIELRTQERIDSKIEVVGDIVLPKKYSELGLVPSIRIQPVGGRAVRHGDLHRLVSPSRMPGFRFVDVLDVESSPMQGRYSGEGGSELFRWKANLSEGDYLFVVEPFQYGVQRTVSRTPNSKLRITVPDLFPTTILAIDSMTRQPVDGATVRWSRSFEKDQIDGSIEIDLGDEGVSRKVYIAAGKLTVAARAPGYAQASTEVLVRAGVEEITLEMSRCISREVVLMHDGMVIPWERKMTCHVRTLGSDYATSVRNPGDGTMRACFERQGLHELLIGEVDGFQVIPPVQVDVTKDDNSRVVVQLER